MVRGLWDLGASGVGSKVWVLTLRVLEVNPEVDSVRTAREARFLVECFFIYEYCPTFCIDDFNLLLAATPPETTSVLTSS